MKKSQIMLKGGKTLEHAHWGQGYGAIVPPSPQADERNIRHTNV